MDNKNNSKSLIFYDVYNVIQSRKKEQPEGSYVASLFQKGLDKILKKIGEEAGEVIIASKNDEHNEIIHEVADLWFHTLVTMAYHDIDPDKIFEELEKRFK